MILLFILIIILSLIVFNQILFSTLIGRLTIVSFICAGVLVFNTFYIQSIGSGTGMYEGIVGITLWFLKSPCVSKLFLYFYYNYSWLTSYLYQLFSYQILYYSNYDFFFLVLAAIPLNNVSSQKENINVDKSVVDESVDVPEPHEQFSVEQDNVDPFDMIDPAELNPYGPAAYNHYDDDDLNKVEEVEKKKITKTSSVNLLDIAKAFYLEHPTLKYDFKEQIFYLFDKKEQIWQQYNEEEIRLFLLFWLKNNEKFPNIFKKIKPNNYADLLSYLKDSSTLFSDSKLFLEGGFAALKKKLFCMQDKKDEVKSSENGVLIPFKNGVLIKSHANGTDNKLFKAHNIDFYTTYKLNVEYQPDAVIENTIFEKYLNSLTGNNPNKLNILRACLHCIIVNNTSYQLGLYFYGPGGTGKSTLMNILQYILGSDGAYSSSLKNLNGHFGLTNLINKLLVIINDTPYFRGIEPPILKQIISGDPMEVDIKYKKPIEIVPKAWVIIVSNTLWDLKNPTSGIGRRMVYFFFDNIPDKKIPNLFNLKTNNEMKENLLLPYLPGFINWVLDCPEEYLNQLNLGGEEISEILNPEIIKMNPLSKWIEENLIQEEDCYTSIGIDATTNSTLLGNYNIWAKINNLDSIGKLRFSEMLLDTLLSKKWPNVYKKRTSVGTFIVGVRLRKEPLMKE